MKRRGGGWVGGRARARHAASPLPRNQHEYHAPENQFDQVGGVPDFRSAGAWELLVLGCETPRGLKALLAAAGGGCWAYLCQVCRSLRKSPRGPFSAIEGSESTKLIFNVLHLPRPGSAHAVLQPGPEPAKKMARKLLQEPPMPEPAKRRALLQEPPMVRRVGLRRDSYRLAVVGGTSLLNVHSARWC